MSTDARDAATPVLLARARNASSDANTWLCDNSATADKDSLRLCLRGARHELAVALAYTDALLALYTTNPHDETELPR